MHIPQTNLSRINAKKNNTNKHKHKTITASCLTHVMHRCGYRIPIYNCHAYVHIPPHNHANKITCVPKAYNDDENQWSALLVPWTSEFVSRKTHIKETGVFIPYIAVIYKYMYWCYAYTIIHTISTYPHIYGDQPGWGGRNYELRGHDEVWVLRVGLRSRM